MSSWTVLIANCGLLRTSLRTNIPIIKSVLLLRVWFADFKEFEEFFQRTNKVKSGFWSNHFLKNLVEVILVTRCSKNLHGPILTERRWIERKERAKHANARVPPPVSRVSHAFPIVHSTNPKWKGVGGRGVTMGQLLNCNTFTSEFQKCNCCFRG